MLRKLGDLDVSGKRVLVRVDFNVSVEKGTVVDDWRVRASLPTIHALRDRGAKAILLLSHRGRPDGRDEALSLSVVAQHLAELLGEPVAFVEDCVGSRAEDATRDAGAGAVYLLENVRFHREEQRNDRMFAEAIAKLGEVFVNDAFGVAHRAHASTVGLAALLPSAAGIQVLREVEILGKVRDDPAEPFVVVVGGAKISTKLPLIEHLLPVASRVCLGGALANTVLLSRGVRVGRSRVESDMRDALPPDVRENEKLLIVQDAIVSTDATGGAEVRICAIDDVADDEMILDIGPETAQAFAEAVANAKTVFWNGPMGVAEVPAFRHGTDVVARAVADSKGFSVVGGGDTTRYPLALGLAEKIDFLSTGGGATLEFLAGRPMPALDALTTS